MMGWLLILLVDGASSHASLAAPVPMVARDILASAAAPTEVEEWIPAASGLRIARSPSAYPLKFVPPPDVGLADPHIIASPGGGPPRPHIGLPAAAPSLASRSFHPLRC